MAADKELAQHLMAQVTPVVEANGLILPLTVAVIMKTPMEKQTQVAVEAV